MVRPLFGSLASKILESKNSPNQCCEGRQRACLIFNRLSREKCPKSLAPRVIPTRHTSRQLPSRLGDFRGSELDWWQRRASRASFALLLTCVRAAKRETVAGRKE